MAKRIELKESGVLFDKDRHSYSLDGKFLSGITGMLQRQLYPDEYKNIDEAVLNKAAEYGTGVHESCEEFDTNWINDGTQELADYIQICKDNGLVHELSEYTVTDKEHWASNIDKVYRVDDETFDLGDIKTYGQLTPEKKEKARWQLSIYAYLFELQNKKAKVGRLFILHLRNKEKRDGTFDHIAEIVFVKRIPSDICKSLLEADVNGTKFDNPFDVPDEYKKADSHIRELIEQKNSIEQELSALKEKILADMESKEQKTWTTESLRFTRKLPSVRTGFDLKKFKEDHPEIDYKPYETTTNVSGSLTITL